MSSSSSKPPPMGSISPNCPCDTNISLPPLKAAPHPYNNTAYVFSLYPQQQLIPYIQASGGCSNKPGYTGRKSIRFHVFSDGVYQAQTYQLPPDPTGSLQRQNLRTLDPAQLKIKGWNKTFGTQPGYSRGREITVESGKVELGKITQSDAYQSVTLSSSTTTVNGNTVTELRGCSGKYIKTVLLYYKNVKNSNKDVRFHMVFKFDVESSQTCNSQNQQSEVLFQQEAIIDNIGVTPTDINGTAGKGYVAIDCRYHLADVIQLYGTQLELDHAVAICLDPQIYRDNVVVTDAYSAAFDSTGRLFVFYEDHKIFTKDHTGNLIKCECPSSSSSKSSSSSTTGLPGGRGTAAGGAGGGGGGGGGGMPGGGGGGGTIFRSSSSSSSKKPGSSSSAQPSSSSSGKPSSSSSTKPGPLDCPGRDCLGCTGNNKKTYNSFTVGFSGYEQWQLCLQCDACQGDTGFLRIEPGDLSGPFCIQQDCDNKCVWENTVYIRAITKKCKNTSCSDEFFHTLLPLHIKAVQANGKWTLTAQLADSDCKVYTLFSGAYDGSVNGKPPTPPYDACDLPGAFSNTASGLGALSSDVCCLCFPLVKETSNISCLMSPDMGTTWYDFKGLIRLVEGELARKPVVTHDHRNNKFHLFYILQGKNGDGVFHKTLDATLFDENDAFIDYIPIPDITAGTSDSTGLTQFSPAGQTIRRLSSDMVSGTLGTTETNLAIHRYATGKSFRFTSTPGQTDIVPTGTPSDSQIALFNGTSDETTDPASVQEYDAYIDTTGRLYFYYFDKRGSLGLDQIDVPPQFFGGEFDGQSWFELRYNATLTAKLNCPSPYTFTVTGMKDTDCECTRLSGDHNFIQHGGPGTYISGLANNPLYTMTFKDPYWVIESSNGMLTFQRKRNSLECPTLGFYTLVCSRCIGDTSSSSGGSTGIRGELKAASSSSSSGMGSSSSSSATIRPYDAVVRVLSSADGGRTWTEELPGRGGHFGALAYDERHDYAYMFYVTDDMLFCRRYPSFLYHEINDTKGAGQLTVETILAPIDPGLNFDPGSTGVGDSLGTIGDIGSQISLPVDEEEVATVTTTSPATPALSDERDKNGVPTFCAGEKTSGFQPFAFYPYTKDFSFDESASVGAARPAAFVTPGGGVRFFYIDQNGNINGGYLPSPDKPVMDMKVSV